MKKSYVGALLLLGAVAVVGPALACGGFFRARARGLEERTPSLAYEQTLIVFDADAGGEEFVREVVFRDSKEPFGFVVPTPARPAVRAIKKSPFPNLQRDFPFGDEPERARAAGAAMRAGGGARSPRPVEVLEERQVGSFKTFVLAATDSRALSDWLTQNGFVATASTEAWLAHYVKLAFFYVAMRYQPEDTAEENKTTAETIGISFASPLPYYPYLEPSPEPGEPPRDARMLEVWLASQRRYAPVARSERGERALWVRPMQSGRTYQSEGLRPSLAAALGEDRALLPKTGSLVVQRFADQKRSRAGFGDVVFVPVGEPALTDEQRATLAPLARLLDPSLAGEP